MAPELNGASKETAVCCCRLAPATGGRCRARWGGSPASAPPAATGPHRRAGAGGPRPRARAALPPTRPRCPSRRRPHPAPPGRWGRSCDGRRRRVGLGQGGANRLEMGPVGGRTVVCTVDVPRSTRPAAHGGLKTRTSMVPGRNESRRSASTGSTRWLLAEAVEAVTTAAIGLTSVAMHAAEPASRTLARCVMTQPLPEPISTHSAGLRCRSSGASAESVSTKR